jgi:hypothetical protein
VHEFGRRQWFSKKLLGETTPISQINIRKRRYGNDVLSYRIEKAPRASTRSFSQRLSTPENGLAAAPKAPT